jgi:hypothetical protein
MPKFHRFRPQTAVNHENGGLVAALREIGYRY